jgi:hypothetical protein
MVRRLAPSDRNNELRELAREMHALSARPLYELFRELDAGAPLLQTLRAYSDLPLAGFTGHLGRRDL